MPDWACFSWLYRMGGWSIVLLGSRFCPILDGEGEWKQVGKQQAGGGGGGSHARARSHGMTNDYLVVSPPI